MTHSNELDELIEEIDSFLAKDRSSLPASGYRLLEQSRDILEQIRDDPSSFTKGERREKLISAAMTFMRFVVDPNVLPDVLGHAEELLD